MGKWQKMPPLCAADFERVIEADGWYFVEQEGSHRHFKHPTKSGKVTIGRNWTGVKTGDWVFRSVVVDQAGMTKKQFVEIYWGRTKR